jgi:hypothetical protein
MNRLVAFVAVNAMWLMASAEARSFRASLVFSEEERVVSDEQRYGIEWCPLPHALGRASDGRSTCLYLQGVGVQRVGGVPRPAARA